LYVQLDRLVKEFIILLEKQISSEQEEKQVVENELQEIVGQKRRACTIDTASTSSASKELVAAGGTRRIKRVKVVVKVALASPIMFQQKRNHWKHGARLMLHQASS